MSSQQNSQSHDLTRQAESKTDNVHLLSLQATKEAETYYRQNIIAYTERLGQYTHQIENLKTDIDRNKKLIQKDEENYISLERTVEYDQKTLQKYNDTFSQKIDSIQELEREYKKVLNHTEYIRLEQQKRHELQKILDEIEELEMALLLHELERINLLLALEPKRKQILDMQTKLASLQLDKTHFEYIALQHIALLPNKKEPQANTVDTEIMDNLD